MSGEHRGHRRKVARRFEVGELVPHFFYLFCRPEAAVADRELTSVVEAGLAELGFELVELEKGGTASRPILRLRIDRAEGAGEEAGVSVQDCARVSRALEARLEARPGAPATYVLEVSSPGVERPLVRRRDFERFTGREVALHGKQALAGRSRTLTGELLGVQGEGPAEEIGLRLADGTEIRIPRADVTRANLVFRWGSEGRRT